MNVKEPHVVVGMSRDSAVSQQNPNLVYDAKNIRITTKDSKNSLLSVTNEKGTSTVSVPNIVGDLVGYSIVNSYLVLFTHRSESPYDHIYRIKMPDMGAPVSISANDVFTVFSGNANFDLEHPIQTLPIFENDNLQKVYWVDGLNQPRVINIAVAATITNADFLNFSREVALAHTFNVTKYSTGGEFPVGTVQYAFSYYTKFGQESCLADVSPMYYLSPMECGLDATSIAHCSFRIEINTPDANFDYVRIYAIVRTSANTVPQCRVVGDYAIESANTPVVATDDGIKGETYPAASMYVIGGEEMVAGTLAEKDNTLFLGNIALTKPNVGDTILDGTHSIRYYMNGYADGSISQATFGNNVGNIVDSSLGYSPDDNRVPTNATKYYDYNPNNNRSSYYIRRFKYLETYRFGFIAQYKNGQWSEPVWVGDFANNYTPNVGAGNYRTGCFHLNMPQNIITKLQAAGFKRIAPVVVYPQAHERRCVMQGLLCPTMYNKKDRNDNSPYAQSSWFFRLYHNVTSEQGSYYWHNAPIGGCGTPQGEIQCIDTSQQGMYYMDGNVVTFHSPDIECAPVGQNTDFEGLNLSIVGFASASISRPTDLGDIAKVTDHFIETENAGIRTGISQIIAMKRTGYTGYSMDNFCYPLYFDGVVANESNDEVVPKENIITITSTLSFEIDNPACGWIVYPWHRQGSLNNQQALSTKQRSNGFNTRTAMLKKNITANAWFTNSTYFSTPHSLSSNVLISTPKLFNYDQLASVKIAAGNNSIIYYGNIDKVITAVTGKYPIYYGWRISITDAETQLPNISQLSEDAMNTHWWDYCYYNNDEYYTGTDPVSMKYKSSPHAVFKFTSTDPNQYNTIHIPMHSGDKGSLAFANSGATGSGLWIAEFIRNVDAATRFGGKSEQAFVSNDWIRCGESRDLASWYHATSYLEYQQGDCYIQRYDCLKTYPFTNEDMNSVIETLSATLETYVNLDFRYDHNRGSGKNVALSPLNFNLYNHPAYEQVNNFFTYHGLDYDRYVRGAFPNGITWTLSKNFGEDVDTWTSIDVSNMTELDGSRGEVTGIVQYKDDLYAFQKGAFARLLFNNRVQIPTSDNTPIEISNGYKMQGVQYISEKIGCSNKWSIVETPLGIYFNDDELHSTYRYNGQLTDLTTTKGLRTFMQSRYNNKPWNPKDFDNCIAFYNKIGRDIYWIYDDACLSFSEQVDNYTSFMDYERTSMMAEINGNTFLWHGNGMHLMHGGNYNYFFGVHKPFWLTFVSNSYPSENKIFNNVAWRDIVTAGSTPKPFHTFDHIRVWTAIQDTQSVRFSNSLSENQSRQPISYNAAMSNLRKKFNVWRCQIPRDKLATNSGRARISNPWCYIKLSREDAQTERLELLDVEVDYFK